MNSIRLPPIVRYRADIGGNIVEQWVRECVTRDYSVANYRSGSIKGLLLTESESGRTTLVVPKPHDVSMSVDEILLCPKPASLLEPAEPHLRDVRTKWLSPQTTELDVSRIGELASACDDARSTWIGRWRLPHASSLSGKGLRPPQSGAIHAALAHWVVTDEPATIVLPTGTGKTEVMITLLVATQPPRLLVVVPSDALRTQIRDKFLTLGLLRKLGVVDDGVLNPVVATLNTTPENSIVADRLFSACNVIVTTAALVTHLGDEIQQLLADRCSHLFVDEAHHIRAKTWYSLRGRFENKPIIQFTATPYRGDKQLVDGRPIFSYPLHKAQKDGFYSKIRFVPIDEYPRNIADVAIAHAAQAQLKSDLEQGFDHVVLARVQTIKRAKGLAKIYEEIGIPAVVVHSELPAAQLQSRMLTLKQRHARVAICVDMFGEGFDMPELKIAAMHDVHRSLAVTMQFIGRFARSKDTVGDATVIANLADAEVEGALRALYIEDADWNALLPDISARTTRRHTERAAFLGGFNEQSPVIPLASIEPKMSAVVYKTSCDQWAPEKAAASVPRDQICYGPFINAAARTVLFVTRETELVPWGRMSSPQNESWQLYLSYWDSDRQLLFINSSNNDVLHESLASNLTSKAAVLIDGDKVFRSLHGMTRLQLMNLGLKHSLNRSTRFVMYVGPDVLSGLSEASQENRIKTNLFAKGFEKGERATMGCSVKGRIWSHHIAEDVSDWIGWCQKLGSKLIDDSIKISDLLTRVMQPKVVEERPALYPTAIEWPDEFVLRYDLGLEIEIDDRARPFFDAEICLIDPNEAGPLRFALKIDDVEAIYELSFANQVLSVNAISIRKAYIKFQRRGRVAVSEVFAMHAPIVRFAGGEWLEGNRFFVPTSSAEPFSRDRIEIGKWTGTDLTCESQGAERNPASIQYRVIERLKAGDLADTFEMVIDDDGANEVADIVAMRIKSDVLEIHLFHCKFSRELPGGRIKDLYEVCGQAQKSVKWRSSLSRMLEMLMEHDASRELRTGKSRIEVGDGKKLRRLKRRAHLMEPQMHVWVVQPGLSRERASDNQLRLLGVTELYLQETHNVSMRVIGSA